MKRFTLAPQSFAIRRIKVKCHQTFEFLCLEAVLFNGIHHDVQTQTSRGPALYTIASNNVYSVLQLGTAVIHQGPL